MEFTPILPRDLQGNIFEKLIIKAERVILKSETLNCVHTSQTISAISKMLYTVNSYYSNQIESEGTHPISIEKAMKKEYSKDSKERSLQTLSINYIQTQKMLYSKVNDTSAFDLETICLAHKFLYSQEGMESFLEIKSNDETRVQMTPGALRNREVQVGMHIPPSAHSLLGLLTQMLDLYNIENKGTLTKRLILALAFHHRLTWIHPFLDGNGRVSRLILDLSLKQLLGESYGIWNIARGLARDSKKYKVMLNNADMPRQGDMDGRGALSTKELCSFVEYMLDIALDQIEYMSSCLKLDSLSKRVDEYVQIYSTTLGPYGKLLPKETNLILKELLLKGEIARGEVGIVIHCSRRKATDITKALLDEGILASNGIKDKLRINFNAHMSQFIFPELVPALSSQW
jgi:Fic family protein